MPPPLKDQIQNEVMVKMDIKDQNKNEVMVKMDNKDQSKSEVMVKMDIKDQSKNEVMVKMDIKDQSKNDVTVKVTDKEKNGVVPEMESLIESHVEVEVDIDKEEFSDDEEEDLKEKLQKADFVGRVVLNIQNATLGLVVLINQRFHGHFFFILVLLLYVAYFIYAMCYRFGDEGSIRLLACTILAVVISTRHRVAALMSRLKFVQWCKSTKTDKVQAKIATVNFFLRWLLYGGVGAFIGYVIVDVAIKDPIKLTSLPGLFILMFIAFLFSTAPSKVNWHTIYWSLGMQFIIAVIIIRWDGGRRAILWVQKRLDEFFANSEPASQLLFGETYKDHFMVFGALPAVFLTNAALSMLYYVGAMQFMVGIIGTAMRFVLGTSVVESTGVAASIFMEGATALLSLRPYLKNITKSEFFTITTSCLASIGGAYLAILTQIGISVEFLLPAMVISAPATFTICKLMVPETKKPKKIKMDKNLLPDDMKHSNILEAASAGATSVTSLVANVIVTAFAFLALISWFNKTIAWFGERVGVSQLSMEKILGYLLYPFALFMGVELADCRQVAMLMGLRLASSSFVSMLKMPLYVHNRNMMEKYLADSANNTVTYVGDDIVLNNWNMTLVEGFISRRSEAIATFALCGFSGVLSLFITMGIVMTLVPHRRAWLVPMAIPLLVAGNFSNFMVGCFAGLLM